ncbi:transcriptional regulator [Limnohabitans planktonicus]|jgi:predicted transcriptional regulator|uniref:Transcriptional regulator n=1 Tax=Limnohabitans planktonicus II-D5 TaxID=1293045 RepID=A0A2T7UHJ2_9BURK|nr:transcriptional regulator [Limnohabitans planktonicus]PVE44156.1 transcriptional regulator [Limnohabitans planktonicus II-D5]
MKTIVVGILSQEKIRERMLSIARGDYKPKSSDPKIWFTSMRSLAEVLSDDNRALLKVIQDSKPQSISSLADITGRKPGNLSRTLKTMSNYGFVEMKRENRHVRPIVKGTDFRIVA